MVSQEGLAVLLRAPNHFPGFWGGGSEMLHSYSATLSSFTFVFQQRPNFRALHNTQLQKNRAEGNLWRSRVQRQHQPDLALLSCSSNLSLKISSGTQIQQIKHHLLDIVFCLLTTPAIRTRLLKFLSVQVSAPSLINISAVAPQRSAGEGLQLQLLPGAFCDN